LNLKARFESVHHILASSALKPNTVNTGLTQGQPGVNLHRPTGTPKPGLRLAAMAARLRSEKDMG